MPCSLPFAPANATAAAVLALQSEAADKQVEGRVNGYVHYLQPHVDPRRSAGRFLSSKIKAFSTACRPNQRKRFSLAARGKKKTLLESNEDRLWWQEKQTWS